MYTYRHTHTHIKSRLQELTFSCTVFLPFRNFAPKSHTSFVDGFSPILFLAIITNWPLQTVSNYFYSDWVKHVAPYFASVFPDLILIIKAASYIASRRIIDT